MPRTKVPLPEGFEEKSDEPTKMRCVLCFKFSPYSKAGQYQRRSPSGATAHFLTKQHKDNVEKQQKQEEDERQSTLNNPYAGSSSLHAENFSVNIPPPPPSFQDRSIPEGVLFPNSMPEFTLEGMEVPRPFDPQEERENLRSLFEQILMRELLSDSEESEDASETNIVELLRSLGLDEDGHEAEAEESLFNPTAVTEPNKVYAPYPSKLMMLLDIMDNLPRLRLSSAHFRLILWLLKEAGVLNVPTYNAFRKMQSDLQTVAGSEPKPFTSSLGNHFYVNDLADAVKRNFANPHIAPHLNFYPEEMDGPISEVWQCDRWKEFSPNEHTPMYSTPSGKQFYINEVAELHDNRLAIPTCWIKRNGVICADAHIVTVNNTGLWIKEPEIISIPSSQFKSNYPDIMTRLQAPISWQDPYTIPDMPNSDRKLVPEGYDLYDVFYPLWADDVSGNRSKQYNKHINMYTVNSNLPGRLLQQEYFVQFVSTSPNASAPEQFSALKDMIKSKTHKEPILCYNAHTKRMCGARLRVPSLPADNPQQAEEASHTGGNANHLCRKCNVGGSYHVTESDNGYHSLFAAKTDIIRSAEETRQRLYVQLKMATTGNKSAVEKLQRETGTKDTVARHWIDILLKKATKLKQESPDLSAQEVTDQLLAWLEEQPGDKFNPLLDIAGLDPTQDTPVEILHTILLGIVKYVWHFFHPLLSDEQKDLFVIRLQSTDLDGLTVPPLRAAYIMQYRNNLIGKHFKTLMQTMAFHVQDIVMPKQFELIKSVGELGAMLWVHEIENMDIYLKDLEILVGNTLDAFAAVEPTKIIHKVKLHLLPHMISDIRRFGPIIRNSTEGFECFNAVFRMCSVYSNGQAPSRDIAQKFTRMDQMKHILSGGYWHDESDGWIQASSRVRNVLESHPIIQRHLGWIPKEAIKFGTMKPLAQRKTKTFTWLSTQASSVLEQDWLLWQDNASIIAQSGDSCKIGSWVAVSLPNSDEHAIGRIIELLSPSTHLHQELRSIPSNIVTVEHFILGSDRHPNMNMPVLYRSEDASERAVIAVKTSDIQFRLSVQHDCRRSKCKPTGSRNVIQEHQTTSRKVHFIEHSEDNHFILNMHALHNASLVRRLLPRVLTSPKLLHEDRETFHHEVATELRSMQQQKRNEAQKRRNANTKRKKELHKVQREEEEESGQEEEQMDEGNI